MRVDADGSIHCDAGDPNPVDEAEAFWLAVSQVGYVDAPAFAAQARAAWDFRTALAKIADLPGPHYSATTREALRIAREALDS